MSAAIWYYRAGKPATVRYWVPGLWLGRVKQWCTDGQDSDYLQEVESWVCVLYKEHKPPRLNPTAVWISGDERMLIRSHECSTQEVHVEDQRPSALRHEKSLWLFLGLLVNIMQSFKKKNNKFTLQLIQKYLGWSPSVVAFSNFFRQFHQEAFLHNLICTTHSLSTRFHD